MNLYKKLILATVTLVSVKFFYIGFPKTPRSFHRYQIEEESDLEGINDLTFNFSDPFSMPLESFVETTTVYNPDYRVPFNPSLLDKKPFRVVGILKNGYSYCTATLVSPSVILTARHCVVLNGTDSNGFGLPSKTFLKNAIFENSVYKNGKLRKTKLSETISKHRISPPSYEDWALLSLAEPTGKDLGFIPVEYYSRNEYNPYDEISIIGYPRDMFNFYRTGAFHHGCYTRGTASRWGGKQQMILHDCDTFSGNSGSGVISGWESDDKYSLEDLTIIGVHYGHFVGSTNINQFTFGTANIFEPSASFASAYQNLTNLDPSSPNSKFCKTIKKSKCKLIRRRHKCKKFCKCKWNSKSNKCKVVKYN